MEDDRTDLLAAGGFPGLLWVNRRAPRSRHRRTRTLVYLLHICCKSAQRLSLPFLVHSSSEFPDPF
jgi:hypothetical protein